MPLTMAPWFKELVTTLNAGGRFWHAETSGAVWTRLDAARGLWAWDQFPESFGGDDDEPQWVVKVCLDDEEYTPVAGTCRRTGLAGDCDPAALAAAIYDALREVSHEATS